jgi:hypothetical protein
VYAPFIFKSGALVDQRCNALSPVREVPFESLAAALTSTLFAYSLEINGSASMGAGALEAPTTHLRSYPVFDVQRLSSAEHKTLQKLAQAVWEHESPPDWTDNPKPGKCLQELDQWLLSKADDPITRQTLYKDLQTVCDARIVVAKDKNTTTKKHKSDSISNVAKSIAETIGKLLQSRRFPEDFCPIDKDDNFVSITLPRAALRKIDLHPFMDTAELRLTGGSGELLFSETLDLSIAEAIVRALLAGRESFMMIKKTAIAETGMMEFIKWFSKIKKKLEDGIASSALGTGYEEQLTMEVYKLVGLHPRIADKTLPNSITISR